MTNPTEPEVRAAEEAIWAFDFDDYGMGDVAAAMRDRSEYQEWVPALARSVSAAVVEAVLAAKP